MKPAPLIHQDNHILHVIRERLGVVDATEIWLEELDVSVLGATYLARSTSRTTQLDRRLAIRLRMDGAHWCGEIARDPCAVA